MNTYTVRRSKISLFIGYLVVEAVLISILVAMSIIWQEDPTYLDWPVAITSWGVVAVFFHLLLLKGTFYKVNINGDVVEYHAFLRKTKAVYFSDIRKVEQSSGFDMKIVGENNKKLFCVKITDRNYDRFMLDLSKFIDMHQTQIN